MKIGLISDTHQFNPDRCEIPDWIKTAFNGVEMIIHAGDVEHTAYLTNLERIAPVYAVRGHCDSYELRTPVSRSIDIGCGLLTVAHRPNDAQRAVTERTKVVVYGHTHISTVSQEEDILVINPGSPTLPRGGLPPSVAVLDTATMKAEIIYK